MSRTFEHLCRLLAVVALAIGASSVVPTAQAATERTGGPVIMSPSAGSQLEAGLQAAAVIDFSEARVGQYSVSVYDAYGYDRGHGSWSETFGLESAVVVNETTGRMSFEFTQALLKPGRYIINVADAYAHSWSSPFQVITDGTGKPSIAPIVDVEFNKPTVMAVDMSEALIGRWEVEVCTYPESGGGECVIAGAIDNTQATGAVSFELPAQNSTMRVLVTVYHGYFGPPDMIYSQTSYQVTAPLELSEVSAVPQQFFPTVRDGFKDRTTIRWQTTLGNAVAAHVRVFAGPRQVFSATTDRSFLTWNGKDNEGRVLAPGSYRVEVTARSSDGQADVGYTSVTIARRLVRDSGQADRKGSVTSSHASSDGCYVSRVSGSATLDCWGGRQATVTYAFAIPREATTVEWNVAGAPGCCTSGHISKTARRTGPRIYVATVRVTGWRSYTVRKVEISWRSSRWQ